MTHKERILATLRHRGPLCDDCLANTCAIRPRQTVNIVCRQLAGAHRLQREKRPCPQCGKVKLVNLPCTAPLPDTLPSRPTPLSEDHLKQHLKHWLERQGWQVRIAWGHDRGIDVEARRDPARWVIEVKGAGAHPQMRNNYFLALLGTILQRMDDPRTRYTIALPDLPQFRGLWSRLPPLAKRRTGLTALFVGADGQVTEVP